MTAEVSSPPIEPVAAAAVNWGRRIYFAMVGVIGLLALIPVTNHFRIGSYESLRAEIIAAGGRAPRAAGSTRSQQDNYWEALGGDLSSVVIREVEIPPHGRLPAGTLSRLNRFPEIEQLSVEGHLPDRATCRAIFRMSKLGELKIRYCELTDDLLQGIDQMQGLSMLDLSGTDISDASIEQLSRLRGLSELDLRFTNVTAAGRSRLAQALAGAEIRHASWPSPAHSQAARRLFRAGALLEMADDGGVTVRVQRKLWTGHDDDLRDVAYLQGLTNLELEELDLKTGLMNAVASLKNVHTLTINQCRSREADLAALGASQTLTKLVLIDVFVDASVVEKLAAVRQLESLVLNQSRIVPGSLSAMSQLANLRELSLVGTRFRGTVMSEVASVTSLRKLELIAMPMGDVQIEEVCALADLESLSIQGTMASDGSVPHLSRLVRLKRLDVSETPITAAGVQRLQSALSGCKIETQSGKGNLLATQPR